MPCLSQRLQSLPLPGMELSSKKKALALAALSLRLGWILRASQGLDLLLAWGGNFLVYVGEKARRGDKLPSVFVGGI